MSVNNYVIIALSAVVLLANQLLRGRLCRKHSAVSQVDNLCGKPTRRPSP